MSFIKRVFFLLSIPMLLFSCQSEITRPVATSEFFDLKAYFKQEQVRLKNINKAIKKASVNGKIEEKTIEGINFEEELALFADSDINKISWIDKYAIDSTFNKNQLMQITYQALDERLKTNLLTVNFNKEGVTSIDILRKTSSIAAEMEQHLIYTSLKGYSIESTQQTSFSEPHVLRLDVQFVR